MEIIQRCLKPSDMLHARYVINISVNSDIAKWFKENEYKYNRLRTKKVNEIESVMITFCEEKRDVIYKTVFVQLKKTVLKLEYSEIKGYLIDEINDEFDKYQHALIFMEDESQNLNGKVNVLKDELSKLENSVKNMI